MAGEVLVTGGAGFVGSGLIRRLLSKGYGVAVFDNMLRGSRERLPDDDSMRIIEGDIRNASDVRRALESKPQFVVHLAAHHYIPYCNEHPADTILVNVYGTQVLLEEVKRNNKAEKVIFASSAAVYRPSPKNHQESEQMAPIDIYGVSKQIGEQLVEFFHRQTGLPSLSARLFNVIGPRETNPHLLPDIIEQLPNSKHLKLGNLMPKRDYIYVDDVADGLVQMLESTATTGSFNIGTGSAYSAEDMVNTIGEIIGSSLSIDSTPERQRAGDRPFLCANNARVTELGWRCRYDFRQGLENTLAFYGIIKGEC
jgi:UDP-glucose 4-epimerase